MEWHVGQIVLLQRLNPKRTPHGEGTITAIARKYMTVKSGHGEQQFEIATGLEKRGQYTATLRVLTQQQWDDKQEADGLLMELHVAQVNARSARLSLPALRSIAAIVREDRSGGEQA